LSTTGSGDAEIVGLRPADACILGVDAKAKAVDEFIDTITRTSIFSGLPAKISPASRASSTRLVVSLVAVSVPWWRALGLIR
jgi:hypothetical protein